MNNDTTKPTPHWNSSTTCLQVLYHTMADQGWDAWQPPAAPSCDYDSPRFEITVEFELPRRPLDLGVGLWR